MSVPSPLMRRRTSSHGETERKSFLFDEEGEGEDGFRRRVVSFTSPETSTSASTNTNTNKSKGHAELRNGDPEQRYAGPRGGLLQRSQVNSSSGEDIPDGIIKNKKGGEDVPDGGGGGGMGGFRRRLKSMSFGISLSPGSSSHDIRHPPEATVGGGTAGGAGGGGGGGIVNSMVRRSLLQAVWPLSVSLENIEGHYHPLQQHR